MPATDSANVRLVFLVLLCASATAACWYGLACAEKTYKCWDVKENWCFTDVYPHTEAGILVEQVDIG